MLQWHIPFYIYVSSKRIQELLEAFFMFFNDEQKKESIIRMSMICLMPSPFVKPHDAKQWSSGQIILSHPHTHDMFL